MPIHLKVLFFILPMALMIFWLAGNYAQNIATRNEIYRWRNIWLMVQVTAFLTPSIWLFYGVVAFVCLFLVPKSPEIRITTYALLLSSLPILNKDIPGFGLINYLFTLNFPRALTIFLLIPLYFQLRHFIPKGQRQLNRPSDKFVLLFLFIISMLAFRDNTITNILRQIFLNFIDYFVPYYVISRAITSTSQLNKVMLALLISVSISAVIGLFETIKDWHIYNHLVLHLIDLTRLHNFDVRGGYLRAAAAFSSPIVLGYVVTIGLGFAFYLAPMIKNKKVIRILFLCLLAALFSTVSRGPWVGFAFLYLAYIWTGKNSLQQYSRLAFGFIVALPVLLVSPFGRNFIDLLPFIGTIRSETIDYRTRLAEQAWLLFQKHPVFGITNYRETPEMLVMIQGQGIVDVVNSYINLALLYGSVGLIAFLAVFLGVLHQCYKVIKKLPEKEYELIRLGRALFSTLAAVLLIISTVSSINYIPVYYWTLLGIIVAYLTICKQSLAQEFHTSNETKSSDH